jgi:hypothetical protein
VANFPLLKTGAVAQYPLEIASGQASEVIRFSDGTDQRFPIRGRMLRRWRIDLTLLNEDELRALEAFFEAQLGAYSPFVFPDPYSGAPVAGCRFAADQLSTDYEGVDTGSMSLWVIETDG